MCYNIIIYNVSLHEYHIYFDLYYLYMYLSVSICQRCIRKMDHHCPWVNNCVGEGNQKYFVLFAVSNGTDCLYFFND